MLKKTLFLVPLLLFETFVQSGFGGKLTAGLGVIGGNAGLWYMQGQRNNSRSNIIQKHQRQLIDNVSRNAISEVSDQLCDRTAIAYLPQATQSPIKSKVKSCATQGIADRQTTKEQQRNEAHSIIVDKMRKELKPFIATGFFASSTMLIYGYARRGQFVKQIMQSCYNGSDITCILNTPTMLITTSNTINAFFPDSAFEHIVSQGRSTLEKRTDRLIQKYRSDFARCITQAVHDTQQAPYTYIFFKPENNENKLKTKMFNIDQQLFNSLVNTYINNDANNATEQDFRITQHIQFSAFHNNQDTSSK